MFRTLACVIALAIGLLSGGAHANSSSEVIPPMKLDTIMLEMWDDQNIFHQVYLELRVVFPAAPKVAKKAISTEIQRALQALPYAELAKPSASETVKATALSIVHAQPGGETASEVLIWKFMAR